MRKYIVNVVEKRITPFVVEAESEWEAIEKASDGDGYIHQSGSFDLGLDPSSWEVEDYHLQSICVNLSYRRYINCE